jgi:tRNA(fMet)-specific endonuclease VapC
VKYLLDTNAVIAILAGHTGILTRLRQHHPADVALSAIVTHELYFGAYRSRNTSANVARVDALRFDVLEFDQDDARCAGEIRARLAAAGTPIGPYDVLIAGQALARDRILVSRNLREFERVPGLRLENWDG